MMKTKTKKPDYVRELIAVHKKLMKDGNHYAYFELARTRQTDWMAWLCTKAKDFDGKDRVILGSGQGDTPDEACRIALEDFAARGGEEYAKSHPAMVIHPPEAPRAPETPEDEIARLEARIQELRRSIPTQPVKVDQDGDKEDEGNGDVDHGMPLWKQAERTSELNQRLERLEKEFWRRIGRLEDKILP